MASDQPRLSPSPDLLGEFATLRGSGNPRTEVVLAAWLVPLLSIPCLIWPALWNRYPIVFADTGTYLSQAMHHYLGWDRPVFYSLFIWPLHLGLTTWPVILMQSYLTVLVLDQTRRAFGLTHGWLLGLTVFLSIATWLPWTVSELMPDMFTPLLILLLARLVFQGSRLRLRDRVAITLLAAFMIATQQSSVPLALGLLAIVMPVRRLADAVWPAGARNRSWFGTLAPLLAPGLAIIALVLVNTVGFGRVAVSPYGNVFVLARVIYDGPGMTVLRRDCPDRHWRLCPYLDRFPATSDEFLWAGSGPVMLAGGHKVISADADAIIREAVIAQPGRLLIATWDNSIHDFPDRERAAFHAARQQSGDLAVPPPLTIAHRIIALAGIAAAALLLPIAWRRRHVAAWYLAVALLALPLSAAITGGLSTPHDRYQSRIVWLPAAMAFLAVPALMGRRRRDFA
jgi:hypothetical protein